MSLTLHTLAPRKVLVPLRFALGVALVLVVERRLAVAQKVNVPVPVDARAWH